MGDVFVVLFPINPRHQHLDVLPDHLAGLVAEDPLGRRIEGLHDRLLVDGDDAVQDVIDHGADAGLGLGQAIQALPQILFRSRRCFRLSPAADAARRGPQPIAQGGKEILPHRWHP